MSLRVESTLCFTGTEDEPLQVVRVHLGDLPTPVTVSVTGGDLTTPVPVTVNGAAEAEVGLAGHDRYPPNTVVPVTVTATGPAGTETAEATVTTAEPGWTMWMVPHFHYDPVWWNTQAAYTARWDELPDAQTWRDPHQFAGFDLVRAHLDEARRDPDYRFVLAEVDYLKPYWDTHPADRHWIRRLIAAGRLEIVGGTYNEPNTNLTSPESTIRNVVYGLGFQRAIMGADPDTAWQLDVFGHDPQFPGMMSDAGLSTSSWARGPFHQWGPILNPGGEPRDPRRMQFPAEFRWISPSGRGLVTGYMADHYSIGFWMDSAPDLADAWAQVYRIFAELAQVAATRNVLLPVGTDYARPNAWVTEIARDQAARYVWPRFVCATPKRYFDAVRAQSRDGAALWPQTRDMNPVYTGKDVSYIDVKQAQRAAENTLVDAEKFATLAALVTGAGYPDAALDKAWRQLVFGAHHDGITGTFSDQVYLDLLGGWREAYELAGTVHRAALDELAGAVDTTGGPDRPAAEPVPVVVFNSLSWPRTDLVSVRPPDPRVTIVDAAGKPVPSVTELGTVTFLASDVPGVGYRTYWAVPTDQPAAWEPVDTLTAENDAFAVTVDPDRGGALTRVLDKSTGTDLLGGLGNELRLYGEYPTHPTFGEGPWHLLPDGTVASSADTRAEVRAETSPVGTRLTATGTLGTLTYTTELTLATGTGRLDVRTSVDGFTGADQLLRTRFACDLPGALPVSEVGYAVVGRGFALPDVDAKDEPWTLDNPAYTWFGLGSTARVRVAGRDRAIGVAEVVAPERLVEAGGADDLMRALIRVGVTATCSVPDRSRYGSLDVDSNLPDARIAVGGPDVNAFTALLLEGTDAELVLRQLAETGRAWVPAARPLTEVWVPNADLRGPGDLPVLIVTEDAMADLVHDLADALVEVDGPAATGPVDEVDSTTEPPDAVPDEPACPDRTVIVCNRGLPGFAVDPAGGLSVSLFRSCTGWPSGVWIDPPARTTPDGSGFQLQRWSHTFEYALSAGAGDWRSVGAVRTGHGFNHPLTARPTGRHAGRLPATGALLTVESDTAVLGALKATGTPLADGTCWPPDPAERITIRLYETEGRATEARFGGLVRLGELAMADPLETTVAMLDGPVRLGGADIVTVTATPAPVEDGPLEPGGAVPHHVETPVADPLGPDEPASLGPDREPASPVFTRYWLHNTGPAPIGNLPLSVHSHPERVHPGTGPFTLTVTVASDLTDAVAESLVELLPPPGWTAEPTVRPVELEPGEHVEYDVTIHPPEDATDGAHLVAVRLAGPDGQVFEDLTTVYLGPTDLAFGTEVAVGLGATGVSLRPGERDRLPVTLTNRFASPVRGEVRLLGPWGCWEYTGPGVRGFALPAAASDEVRFDLAVPADARPGRYWLLAKVTFAGRVAYTETIPFTVAP